MRTPANGRASLKSGARPAALNRIVLEPLGGRIAGDAVPPIGEPAAADGRARRSGTRPRCRRPRRRVAAGGLRRCGLRPPPRRDIFSTEDLFEILAPRLRPGRVLLAGLEPGVCADFPACTQFIPAITPANFAALRPTLGGSAAVDVTGGMLAKVEFALRLAGSVPGLAVRIFSGEG